MQSGRTLPIGSDILRAGFLGEIYPRGNYHTGHHLLKISSSSNTCNPTKRESLLPSSFSGGGQL